MKYFVVSSIILATIFFIIRYLKHKKQYDNYKRIGYLQEDRVYSTSQYNVCLCDYNQMVVIFNHNKDKISVETYYVSGSDYKKYAEHFVLNKSETEKIILILDSYDSRDKFVKYYNNYIKTQQRAKENTILAELLANSLEIAQANKTKAEEELEKAIQKTQEIVDRIQNSENKDVKDVKFNQTTNNYF